MLSPVSLLDYFGGYHSLALSSDDDCKRTGGAVLGSRNDSNVPKIPADQPNAHYYAVPDELIISHIPLSMQTPGVLARTRSRRASRKANGYHHHRWPAAYEASGRYLHSYPSRSS